MGYATPSLSKSPFRLIPMRESSSRDVWTIIDVMDPHIRLRSGGALGFRAQRSCENTTIGSEPQETRARTIDRSGVVDGPHFPH